MTFRLLVFFEDLREKRSCSISLLKSDINFGKKKYFWGLWSTVKHHNNQGIHTVGDTLTMPWRCFSDVSVMFFQTARSNKTQTSLRSCDITIYNKLTTDHICSKHATWSSPSQQSLAIREKQSQPEVCDGWHWILQLDVESDGRAEFGFKLNPFNWFFWLVGICTVHHSGSLV